MELGDFSTLTFDCYGTLIDWESGIWRALAPAVSGRPDLSRQEVLRAFAQTESALEAAHPHMAYPQILEAVHDELAGQFDLVVPAEAARTFGASVGDWPAFTDSADALRRLSSHFNLVILSNIDRAGFAASQRILGVEFDSVYTAEDIGSYKPDPRNFRYLIDHLRSDLAVEPDSVLHVAQSLFHDHVPARRAGLATAWIDRQGLSSGGEWGATPVVSRRPEFDFLFPSMRALADTVAES